MFSMRDFGLGVHGAIWLLALSAFTPSQSPAQAPRVPADGQPSLESLVPEHAVLFVENRGQFPDGVRFQVQHADGALVFDDRGMVLARHDDKGRLLRLTFVGGREDVRVEGHERLGTKIHYFTGEEPNWRTNVPAFSSVRYREVWPGIDLVFRGAGREVKYDLIVRPGADPRQIRLCYEGATALRLDDDGALVIEREGGDPIRDSAPVAYQGGRAVDVQFAVSDAESRTFGFGVGDYDRSKELVIDPAYVVYCGYAGTNLYGLSEISVNTSGAVYLAGSTEKSKNPPDLDATLIRVNPAGHKIDFVVHIGTPTIETGADVAVDAQGYIYFAGGTDGNPAFPAKVGPSLTFNGPQGDTFVCKLTPDASTIVYCGYIGGSSLDGCRRIAVDGTGSAWVSGHTYSANYPVIGIGGTRLVNPNGTIAKVSADGSALLLSGYLSGAISCQGLAVDSVGNAYTTGPTGISQAAFPVTVGPDLTYNGGGDAFIAKIDGTSGTLHYCGYIGGIGNDSGFDVAVDRNGNAYVAGTTTSDQTSFPVLNGPFPLPGNNLGRGFVAKVDRTGQMLQYSGFIPNGHPLGIEVDSTGSAYIAGLGGAGFPVVNGPVSGPQPPDLGDAFVAKIPPSGIRFTYGGLIVGAGYDEARGIAIDGRGNVYTYGRTQSNETTFPVRVGPGLKYNGTTCTRCQKRDGWFVAKVSEASIVANGSAKIGTTVVFTMQTTDDAGRAYQVATALGAGPIQLGTRLLGLTPDGLFVASVSGALPLIFDRYTGQVGPTGTAAAQLHIPNLAALIGVTLHTAFVTFDSIHPLGIKAISNTAPVQIQP